MIYNYKNLTLEIKGIDKKEGIVEGYFSAFDSKDSDGDIIRKGAFLKSISECGPESQRPRIKHLLNHDPSKPLGAMLSLKEDGYGLHYTSKIGTHGLGVDFIKMAESGLITEHSIGFKTIKEQKVQDANELLEIKLYEGSSLTAWGANEHTPLIGMKSIDTAEAIEKRIKNIEKFCKDSDATDETIEALLIEIKQLNQIIIELKATEPVITTQPELINEKETLAIIELTKQKIKK